MTKVELFNKVTRGINVVGLTLKKHSPEILMGVGAVGTVVSAVMACKATTKVNFVLEDAKEKIEHINECAEKGECLAEVEGRIETVPYVEEDHKKDLAIVYVQTGLEFVKLYGPAVALGAASLACMLTSHRILTKRNIALTAAYTAVERSFKEYRERVVERFGKDLDRELKYNIRKKEIEKVVANEDGTETVVKETVDVIDKDKFPKNSEYARFFDEYCKGWEKNAEHNLYHVLQVQNWANEKLRSEKFLFLNDVYKELGIAPTAMGQMAGWHYDEKHPTGDNFVDFGIYDVHNEGARDFVNGRERSILLDFNVDGNILRYL